MKALLFIYLLIGIICGTLFGKYGKEYLNKLIDNNKDSLNKNRLIKIFYSVFCAVFYLFWVFVYTLLWPVMVIYFVIKFVVYSKNEARD